MKFPRRFCSTCIDAPGSLRSALAVGAALLWVPLSLLRAVDIPVTVSLESSLASAKSGDRLILTTDEKLTKAIALADRNLTFTTISDDWRTITAPSGEVNDRIFTLTIGNTLVFDKIIFQGSGEGVNQNGVGIYVSGSGTGTTTMGGSFTVNGFSTLPTGTSSHAGAIYGGGAGSTIVLGSTGGKVTFSNNKTAAGAGGALRAGHVVFKAAAVLTGNETGATAGGGAIYAANTITFEDTASVIGNKSTNTTVAAGSPAAGLFASGSILFKGNATLADNVNAHGSGAALRSAVDVTFERDVLLQNNQALRGGGGTSSMNGGALWVGTDLTISGAVTAIGNTAAQNGGAIWINNGNLSIGSGSTFLNNVAGTGNGGAIYISTPSGTAKTYRFNALTGDILFRGNTGNGAANALYIGMSSGATQVSQTLELNAAAGRTIEFGDPITTSSGSLLTVAKRGAGTALFDTHVSNVYAATTVEQGTLRVANGATYGAVSGVTSVAVNSGATLSGNGTVRAGSISLAEGATLRATDGGALTLNTSSLTASGVHVAGNGTINAAGVEAATLTADDAGTLTLAQATTLRNGGTISAAGQGTIAATNGLTLAGAATLAAASGQQVTVNAALAGGSGAVTKTGAGVAVLAGANSYAGGTVISEGTLVATSGAALGSGAVANNATLSLAFAQDDTLANVVGGTGALNKTGAGTATLTGANTYSGSTTVAGGTLRIGSAAAATGLGNSAGVVLQGGALDLDGRDAAIASLTGNAGHVALGSGDLTVNTASGARQVYGGTISGTAGSSLVKAGAGTLVLDHAAPLSAGFAGDVHVAAGTLGVTHGTLETSGAFIMSDATTLNLVAGTAAIDAGTVTLGQNAVLNITEFHASSLSPITLISSDTAIAGALSLRFQGAAIASSLDQYLTLQLSQSPDGRTLNLLSGLVWNSASAAHGTFNIADGSTFTSPVALANNTSFTSTLGDWDGRTLTKTGAGTLVFSTANTYTGATQVSAGTLRLAATDAIATSSAVTVAAGATLELTQHQSVNNLSGAGSVVMDGANLTDVASADHTFSGVVAGSGRFVKQGAGTLTLSGANTYSGGTTIAAGRLVATQAAALGTGDVANQGTLEFNTATNGTFAGVIAGNGAVLKTGAGTVTLTGATGNAGSLAVNGGTLALGDGSQTTAFTAATASIGGGAALTVDRNSTLAVDGAFTVADHATLNLVVGSTAPIVSAGSASIGATGTTLNVNGITGSTNMPFTLISTASGIAGEFASINVGGSGGSATDYLVVTAVKQGNNYIVNSELTWDIPSANPNGVFTLTTADEIFNLGTVLTNRPANANTGWDGRSLTKAGAGTLILSAVNTYTGETRVNAGTLRFGTANAIAPSSAVTVAQGATLDLAGFNQTLTNLSGAGSIALGSATLTANNSANTTISGAISGSGALVKQGTGTLTLSGTNTYSGGTTVAAGRLSVTHVNALGTGTVTNNANLDFSPTATGTFAGAFAGNGTINKLGSGTLELTGNSTAFAGTMNAQAGVLAVNGTLRGTLNVASGARLQGTGTVGTTTIASGGIFAPGNSIGTINVAGNLTFASGSVYELEVAPNGTADRINVSGTATIQSGAGVNVVKASGAYSYGSRYTILNALGGVTGNFSALTMNAPLIDLLLTTDANNVYLEVRRNTVALDAYARTPNERAVANAIDYFFTNHSLRERHPLFRAITSVTDEAGVASAYAHLSGEIHASIRSTLVDDSRHLRDAAFARSSRVLAAKNTGRSNSSANSALWLQTVAGTGETNGRNEVADSTSSVFGVVGGVDGDLTEKMRLGLLVGISSSALESDAASAKADFSNLHLGSYGSLEVGPVSLRGGASYTRSYITTKREIVAGEFFDRARIRREATTMQAFGEAGWPLQIGRIELEPFMNVAYLELDSDPFVENGGQAALTGRAESGNTTLGMIGVRGGYALSAVSPKLRLLGSVGWESALAGRRLDQQLSFANGAPFTVSGAPLERDLVVLDVGFGYSVTRQMRLDLGYGGRFGSDKSDHTARSFVSYAF